MRYLGADGGGAGRACILFVSLMIASLLPSGAKAQFVEAEDLFNFTAGVPVLEKPFDVLSGGENIDMFTGGMTIIKDDISIPGRLGVNLTVGHALSSEPELLSQFEINYDWPVVFESHEQISVGQSIGNITRHYGAPIDPVDYGLNPQYTSFALDDVAQLGRIFYNYASGKNYIYWQPPAAGGVHVHWGEYAGIILVTRVYPYATGKEGDRVAYLVKNDGTMEIFDNEGRNVSAAQKQRGVVRYFRGNQFTWIKPFEVCRYPDGRTDPFCEMRRIVDWSHDDIDGIEYVDTSGLVHVFKGSSAHKISAAVKMRDYCDEDGTNCVGDSTDHTVKACVHEDDCPPPVQGEFYAHNVPLYRIEGFRLAYVRDPFGNIREYSYGGDGVVIREDIGDPGSGRKRNVVIRRDGNSWRVWGPLMDSEDTSGPADEYEVDDRGRITSHTNRAGDVTRFLYSPGMQFGYGLPTIFAGEIRGPLAAFVELWYPAGGVVRYESRSNNPDILGGDTEKTRTSVITVWPNSFKADDFLQKKVVVGAPWVDLMGTTNLERSTVVYDFDGSETRYHFTYYPWQSSSDNRIPLLSRKEKVIGGKPATREDFQYSVVDIKSGAKEKSVWAVRGISSHTLHYEGRNFVTTYEYPDPPQNACSLAVPVFPGRIRHPDGGVTDLIGEDWASGYEFHSPLAGAQIKIWLCYPPRLGSEKDGFTDADGRPRFRNRTYHWGGVDACSGKAMPHTALSGYSTVDENGSSVDVSLCRDDVGNIVEARKSYVEGGDVGKTDQAAIAYDRDRLFESSRTIGSATWNYEHDSRGRLTKSTNANGATKNFVYDAVGRLRRIVFGTNGSFREFAYTLPGAMNSQSQASVKITHFDQVRAKQSSSTIAYDGLGRIVSRSEDGVEERMSYNDRGFLESVVTGDGRVDYTYDPLGRVSSITKSDTGTTNYTYDAVNAGWVSGQPAVAVRRAAFSGGRNLRNQYFSIDGKLLRDERIVDGNPIATDYAYDAIGNRIKKVSPKGVETKWIVDALSRVASVKMPSGLEMDVTDWSSNGSPGTISYAGTGQNGSFSYNNQWGNVSQRSYGGSGMPYSVSFGYDATGAGQHGIGRLTLVDDPFGSTDLFYDPSGSLSLYERKIDELNTAYDVGTIKDSKGRTYRLSYSDGRTIYYLADAYGRINEIRLNALDGPIIAGFGYDYRNRLARISYGNGVITAYRYAGDLLMEITINKGNDELYHVEYEYDLRGRRNEAVYHDSSRTTYAYDDADRLTKASYYKANENSPYDTQSYSYDADGNRTVYQDSFKEISYVYHATKPFLLEANYSKDDGWRYAYDDFGRLVERKHIQFGRTIQWQKYVWNNAGQLIRVDTLGAAGNVEASHEYAYDHIGRREKRVRGGSPEYAIYGEMIDPLSELNKDGEIKRDFVYMDGRRIAALDAERIDFFHIDDIGSTLITTDEDSKVTTGYRYDPFGNVNFSIGTWENQYRYAGKHYDDETGFIYFGGRYYDPATGRFISPDPMNEGTNPYSYVGNNPFGSRDLFGWYKAKAAMWRGSKAKNMGGGGDYGGGGGEVNVGGNGMDGQSNGEGEYTPDYGGSFLNPTGGGGFSPMEGPPSDAAGGFFASLFIQGALSIANLGGANINFSPDSPIDIFGMSGNGFGMTDSDTECDEENCPGEDSTESILPDDPTNFLLSEVGSGQTNSDQSSSSFEGGGTGDAGSANTAEEGSEGNGPEIEGAPASASSGTAQESWENKNPVSGTDFSDPARVEEKFADVVGGGEKNNETAGGMSQPDDTPNPIVQDDAGSRKPSDQITGGSDPITLHNGEVVHVERALKISGRGIDFEFVRTYRSRIEYDGPIGYNWDHNYNKRLVKVDGAYCSAHPTDSCCADTDWNAKGANYTACYIRFDGKARYDAYKYDEGQGIFRAPYGYFDRLTLLANGQTKIRDKDGITHFYDADGFCSAIVDRFGNRITLSYSGSRSDKKLARIVDTLGRAFDISYSGKRIVNVRDFSGRELKFSYDASGNLISVTKPATAAFPNGSSVTYEYSSGFPSDKEMLNHNLLSVTDSLGQNFVGFAYSFSDRVVWHRFGEGIFTIESTMMGAWPACQTQGEVNRVASRTRITDRNGNERLYEYNCQGNALSQHLYTRGLRDGDPSEFLTRYAYDLNGLTTSTTKPSGNSVQIEYQAIASGDPSVDRLFASNPVRIRRTPDARGGNPSETVITYEPIAMQILTETRSGRTRTRYYDYQEGAAIGDLARAMDISDAVAANVFAGIQIGLGDLNGDGITNGISANLVRVDEPVVHANDGSEQTIRRSFRYNSFGQLASEIDPNGIETRHSYYSQGAKSGYLEKSVVDPGGLAITTSHDYDARGNRISLTDGSGAETRFVYDERNQLLETTDARGYATQNAYDAEGNLVRIDRPGGFATALTYNPLNRPIVRDEEIGGGRHAISEFRYDPGERLVRAIRPLGNSTITDYDERDLVMRVRKAAESVGEATLTYRYDSNGNLTQETDGTGAVKGYSFDGLDRMTGAIDGEGNSVSTTYDAFDRPIAIARYGLSTIGGNPSELIALKEIVYDEVGRKIIERDWGVSNGVATTSRETKFAYDAAGRKISETDAAGNEQRFEYDNTGRLTKRIDAAGDEEIYAYDGMARPTSVTRREINIATGEVKEFTEKFTYDGLGRKVLHEDALGHVERYSYDGRGNLIWSADAKGAPGLDAGGDAGPGNVTRYEYDGLNRMTAFTKEFRANGAGSGAVTSAAQTKYTWDDNGNLSSVTDANANATSYIYDAMDRKISTTLADGRKYRAEYDAASRPVSETDPRGMIVRKFYDNAGRMTVRTASSGGALLRRDEFSYDGLGRILETKSRDEKGNIISRVEEGYDDFRENDLSRQDGFSIARLYNDTGRVTGVSIQDGISTTYSRDALGRATMASEATLGTLASFSYVGSTRPYEVELGNSLKTSFAYDGDARIASKRVADIDQAIISGFDVGYDRQGMKLYEKRLHEAGNGEIYQYDSLYRMTASSTGVVNPDQHLLEAIPSSFAKHVIFEIDPVDNWKTRTEYRDPANLAANAQAIYVTNSLNQYASIDGAGLLIYDEAGNLIDDGRYAYTYDDQSLLIDVRESLNGTPIATYGYDALKRRTYESLAGGQTTNFIYDGWQVVAEVVAGTIEASYVYDDGIDRPIAMVKDDHTYYYHTDTRNNVTMITDESGDVVERYSYDPYGKATITDAGGNVIADSTIGNSYRFASRQYDSATGLYYYRNRTYSPELGRFMQRDPIWYEDGMNLYGYAGDDPINFSDPFGLDKNTRQNSYIGRLTGLSLVGPTNFRTGNEWLDPTLGIVNDVSNLSNEMLLSAAGIIASVDQLVGKTGCDFQCLAISAQAIPPAAISLRGLGAVASGEIGAALGRADAAIGSAFGRIMVSERGAVGVVNNPTVFRYVSAAEAQVAQQSGFVPNVTQAGIPKNVFYSPENFTSASVAEDALRIGSKNPIGPTASPTYRITADASGANWSYGGNVEGGSGVEFITTEQLPVLRVDPLGR